MLSFAFCSFFFGVGEWFNGCLSNVLFTTAVELQMSGSEHSLLSFVRLVRFVFRSFFFGWVWGAIIAAAPILFFTPYTKYFCFWLSKLPNL